MLLAGTVSPAFGGPTATGGAAKALKTAKRALGVAKQADKRSKLALAAAQQDRSRRPARPAWLRGLSTVPRARAAQAGTKGATGAQGATGAAPAQTASTASCRVTRSARLSIATEATAHRPRLRPRRRRRRPDHDPLLGPRRWPSPRCRSGTPTRPRARDAACCASATAPGRAPASSAMSQTYAFDFPAQSGYDVTTALQGAASKPAGTYNVRLSCWETAGQPLTAIRANLSVFASDG